MDELIQTTSGSQLGFDWSMFWDFWEGARIMEMINAAMISDLSRLSSLYNLLMDI